MRPHEKEYLRLRARVERRFDLVCETVTVGGQNLLFHRVADPDIVFEQMAAEEESSGDLPWQPYWAQAWDSAVAVSRELASRELRNCQVLDVGCGLGLTGAVAAGLGAFVTMVDVAQPSLLFARLNSWTDRQNVTVRRLDWTSDRLQQRFDLIVGSDITYDRHTWTHLESFFRHQLSPDGKILVADPYRRIGDEFIEWLQDRSWQCRIRKISPPTARRPIRLVEAWNAGQTRPG